MNRLGLLLLLAGLAVVLAAAFLWWLRRRRRGWVAPRAPAPPPGAPSGRPVPPPGLPPPQRSEPASPWEEYEQERGAPPWEEYGEPPQSPPAEAAQPPGRAEPRYANVLVTQTELSPPPSGGPGHALLLNLGIGPLDPASAVRRPLPFPLRPRRDVWLRVLVSSTDFTVGGDLGDLARGAAAVERALLLPADGSPSRTESGRPWLEFALRPRSLGAARARIGYYYRDALVQSQRLDAVVGRHGTEASVETDYTASALLDGLERIPATPRLSVLLNDGPASTHQVVLRPPGDGGGGGRPAVPVSLPTESVGPLVSRLRGGLAQMVSSSRARRRRELVEDLRRLAPAGLELHRKLFQQAPEVFGPLTRPPPRPLLSVSRPRNVTFTIPWACLYQIGLPAGVPIERVAVCPLVSEWDERGPLVDGPSDECPRAGEVSHVEGLLCPFGFYGYRQAVEAPASAWDPEPEIGLLPGALVAVAETESGVDRDALRLHVGRLRELFDGAFPELRLDVRESSAKPEIRRLLSRDLPFVYFFCHGQKATLNDPNVALGIGRDEVLPVGEFTDWVAASWALPPVIWTEIRPLVFINACQSLEISPGTLASYVDAFVGAANSVGVIGTEVKVPQNLAMEFAEVFFRSLVAERLPLERALKAARFAFLAAGNLFGLAYSAHAWAHLRVAPAHPGAR